MVHVASCSSKCNESIIKYMITKSILLLGPEAKFKLHMVKSLSDQTSQVRSVLRVMAQQTLLDHAFRESLFLISYVVFNILFPIPQFTLISNCIFHLSNALYSTLKFLYDRLSKSLPGVCCHESHSPFWNVFNGFSLIKIFRKKYWFKFYWIYHRALLIWWSFYKYKCL